jgi:MinD superfamily P-loop ATPase
MDTEAKMRIAVLSGKGGTGKTLVSVNLASVAGSAAYIDCDVEEPNGHLFFNPVIDKEYTVSIKIPVVDTERCIGCRTCISFCQFNALAFIKNKPMVFDEVCHSCGGCTLLCPQQAMSEKEKPIGSVRDGRSGGVFVRTGTLNTGEASGVPIIRKLISEPCGEEDIVFIDCPPGSACIVMESIKDADYCILVAEPTIFGVQNLGIVHALVTLFDKPFGVVLNKCQDDDNPSEQYCCEKGIKIIGKIPFDHELGVMNSNAIIAARASRPYHRLFSMLLESVLTEVSA